MLPELLNPYPYRPNLPSILPRPRQTPGHEHGLLFFNHFHGFPSFNLWGQPFQLIHVRERAMNEYREGSM